MTDARIPERWLYDRRLLHLSDPAHRLFITTLVWSVANRTDGIVYDDDIALLPRVNPGYGPDLEKAGLWRRTGNRIQIMDFADTQTSSRELDILANKRRREREKKARKRAADAAAATSPDTPVPGDIPGGQSPGMSGGTPLGQGQGQGLGEEVQDHPGNCTCETCWRTAWDTPVSDGSRR